MAIEEITWPNASTPSYTPDIENDYNNQNENLEANVRGYNAISLSNWDTTTTAPTVSIGSVIEANGIFYQVITGAESISTSAASSGTIYCYLDVSTPAFVWLDTAPTWSDTLIGWYNSNDRYTGHLCTWNGTTSFTLKSKYAGNSESGDSWGMGPNGLAGEYKQTIIGSSSSWVLPRGCYTIVEMPSNVYFQIYTGSAWVGKLSISGQFLPGLVISDGVNYQLTNFNVGTTAAISYRKLW